MDSIEQESEPAFRELAAESYLDSETDPPLDFDATFHESKYQQLLRDRDELRFRYKREKRDRESLEIKLHQEFDQKIHFEEKLSEVSRNLASYEEELQSLRLENSHLKAQFSQLRTAIQTRVNLGTAAVMQSGSERASLGTGGGIFLSSSSAEGSFSVSNEMYKQEVALLAHENELFKQIIDVIDKQDYSKAILEDRLSGNHNEKQRLLEEEVIRLEREKLLLEDRVRELERFTQEQERHLEEANNKAESDLRLCKRENKVLENELYSKSTVVEDYEFQMSQMKQAYEEEIHQVEIKLEMEISSNKQLQEQTHQLEENIRKIEEERKEILLKIEEAYKSENDIIDERNTLQETYSRDVNELRMNIEEEIQTKAELSMEIERLMAELLESDRQRKEMEDRFFREAQELKLRFEKEREEIVSYVNGSAVNQFMIPTNLLQQTHTASSQLVSGGQGQLSTQEDGKQKLEEEIRKKERLEKENKKLLYQINELLEQNVTNGMSTTRLKDRMTATSQTSGSKQNLKELMDEIEELRETCQILEQEVKKKKEVENKNMELSEKIEELTSKQDEMIRKQRELVKELDNSLSSVRQVEDKNKRLTDDVGSLSRKIREMEENFRNEKEDWIRNFSKDKTSQINDILSEKEILEKKHNEQVKVNRNMEAEINSLETRIYDLERNNKRLERKKSEITAQLTEEINFERNRAKSVKEELDKSVEIFKKQTEQLESTLYDRKKKYDEEIRTLEEEKQRIRNEFDNEKEMYRRRFEEERKTMERRINEIEERLRQQNASRNEFVANQVSLTSDEFLVTNTVNQPGVGTASQQTIIELKKKIDTLTSEKKELQENLYDTERRYSRKFDDMECDSDQKIKKLRSEIEEEYRIKLHDYERQVDNLRKSDSCQRDSKDQLAYQDGVGSMADLVKDHKDQMDELRRQIKIQLDAFESEKQIFKLELLNTTRIKDGEHKCLQNNVQKLTEEVKKLRHEKETLLNKLRKERGSNNSRIKELSEAVTKVREECDVRLRKERESTQKSMNELRRKLSVSENKTRSLEEKHLRELHQLEVKFEYKKSELEQDTTSMEGQLRESLQMEYRVALDKEREKYEETLRVLRKEITFLQEQRKQIQLKLSEQGIHSTYSLLLTKDIPANKGSLFKTEWDLEMRASRGKMEVTIQDLEREIEFLRKEKYDLKTNYKQERAQMQEEFDRERDRLEEKYKRQIEDLKRKLQTTTLHMKSTMFVDKKMRYSTSVTESLHDKNLTLDAKRSSLESQMNFLKGRMDDIEERQTRALQSKSRKATNVRFSTSLERGRDLGRQSKRLSSSMLDLSSSSLQQREKSGTPRIVSGSQKTARSNRETKDSRSFLSQPLHDVRTLGQGSYTRGDQYLASRGHGIGGSSSTVSTLQGGRKSRAPSSFFHARSLSSGFDATRSSSLLQPESTFRRDQLFLPSVGILGGLSQAREFGALGGSTFDGFGSVSGLNLRFGFQRVMSGPSVYGLGVASGFYGGLHHSASLGNLHQQLSSQTTESSSRQAPMEISGKVDDKKASDDTPRQVVSSEEAKAFEERNTSHSTAVPENDSGNGHSQEIPCVNESADGESTALPENDLAIDQPQEMPCVLQPAEDQEAAQQQVTGSLIPQAEENSPENKGAENYQELSEQSEQA
ncbi:hypothetical protein AWC38_SpisGene12110 [Stylophora pistillata]|uniref:Uncharacterized protein n=1 Tax=Stylophora pistillata TaxID=50429 RepID=A0A2B4RY44_STYPI|nr:hypothetical protein AWC38_SpisGene12110 [Stylophora pistillata]